MALNKQPVQINFSQGLERKVDPFQIPIGKFYNLKNSIFDVGGLLKKRNGFGTLTTLPEAADYLTTFAGNLTAIGKSLQAFSQSAGKWVNKGSLQPVELSTLSLIRNNTNQSQCDSAVSSTGLVCTAYTDNVPSGGSNVAVYKYAVAEVSTGQNVVAPTAITVSSGVVAGSPRVFVLGNYFMIVFTNNISGVYSLQYIAISIQTPTNITANTAISNNYTPNSRVNFDGVVANSRLYLAWNGNDGGGAIRMTSITTTLNQSNTVVFSGKVATIMSVTADETTSTPTIYASFYNSGSSTGYTLAVDSNLATVLAPTQIISTGTILNITSSAQDSVCSVFYEVSNAYTYDSGIATNFIATKTVSQAGSVSSQSTVDRSVGLASKSFLLDGSTYMLSVYSSVFQPTFFLLKSNGNVVAKLAYENSGGYLTLGLPNVTLTDTTAQIAYLNKDLIQAVNKTQGAANAAGVYSQTGINLASFDIGASNHATAEIGNDLHLTGGFMWMYDGYSPVEHLFHLWPDNVEVTSSTSGGSIAAQQYFYKATYEWSDNQGNIFRSAPSVPVTVTTTGATSTNTINVPTLRLTYKINNPVKIVLYRWSTAQQTYYQVTSVTIPTMNSTTVDYVAITDTLADSAIIGNNIIYTTGGVVENIATPAVATMTLFDDRLFYINAEDPNVIGFSKQVIETVPVETSDLLTIYVAPNIGVSGPTGPNKCLFPMDDKLIIFKKNAISYINGSGPDNTASNSQYSQPIFITSTVGTENQSSIVFMPSGLMFQSDKGIWLLGRDLQTSYIGAPVEAFTTGATVLSATSISGSNQIRFTLDTGITLMYDYYYGQWGTFVNVPAISSTLYQSLHTYINEQGQVFQETPGSYLDGSKPVLMGFTTGWLNLAGLQGFQRAYEMYLLGTYLSPHKLNVQIAYDYNPSPRQATLITPDNYSVPYGDDTLYGSTPFWGGMTNLEQWRIFFQTQKCESFQITVDEVFDPTFNTVAGAGLTMSGIDMTVGVKAGRPKLSASRQAG